MSYDKYLKIILNTFFTHHHRLVEDVLDVVQRHVSLVVAAICHVLGAHKDELELVIVLRSQRFLKKETIRITNYTLRLRCIGAK